MLTVNLGLSGDVSICTGEILAIWRLEGNVMADYLANKGRSCADKLDFHLGYKEYLLTIKKQIWERWTEQWRRI